jgi:hypothetical protein
MSFGTCSPTGTRASWTGASASTVRRPPAGWPAVPRTDADLGWMASRMSRRLRRSAGPAGARALAALVGSPGELRASPRLGWLRWRARAAARCCHGAGIGVLPPLLSGWWPCWLGPAGCWPSCRARVPALPVLGLAVLALPLLSSLQFYAGYPLRVLTAEASRWLLAPGFDVVREGTALMGRRAAGDRRCALLRRADGVAGLLHRLRRRAVGAPQRPRLRGAPADRRAAGAGRQHGAQQRAGGVRRRRPSAGALGARRAGPAGAGRGVCRHRRAMGHAKPANTRRGVACRTVDALFSNAGWPTASSTASRTRRFRHRHAVCALSPRWRRCGRPRRRCRHRPSMNGRRPGTMPRCARWHSARSNTALRSVFPGAIARMTDGQGVFVLRHVASPTRMLHPAADCYRALGYRVAQVRLENDDAAAVVALLLGGAQARRNPARVRAHRRRRRPRFHRHFSLVLGCCGRAIPRPVAGRDRGKFDGRTVSHSP